MNLDMEEYRDLRAIAYVPSKQSLVEEEFAALNAGIVLQAYLPESHQALANLMSWSVERFTRSGRDHQGPARQRCQSRHGDDRSAAARLAGRPLPFEGGGRRELRATH